MRRTLLIALAVIGLVIVVVVGVGYQLPVEHVASGSALIPQPPDRVFEVLASVERYPSWRSDVQGVDVLSAQKPKRWRERGKFGDITFEEVEQRPASRLVTRIADTSQGFGGSWTIELQPDGGGTRVTITEHGQVFNPVFRFMSRFVFGHTATIEAFLADLARTTTR